jgi:hypothetical protein
MSGDPISLKRLKRLGDLVEEHGIGQSYDSTDPRKRFVAILAPIIDGESGAADSFDTLDDACQWLATGLNPDYPREPALVVDLDTGARFTPRTEVRVTLSDVWEIRTADDSELNLVATNFATEADAQARIDQLGATGEWIAVKEGDC